MKAVLLFVRLLLLTVLLVVDFEFGQYVVGGGLLNGSFPSIIVITLAVAVINYLLIVVFFKVVYRG